MGSKVVFSALKTMDSGLGFETIYSLTKLFPDWLSGQYDVEMIEIMEKTVGIFYLDESLHDLDLKKIYFFRNVHWISYREREI